MADDWFKNALIRLIIDTLTKGDINGIMFTFSKTNISHITSSWEEFNMFVERNCQYTITSVKCFLNTITMMNININVKDTTMIFKQFKNSQNDVINITETTSLTSF